MKTLRWTVLMLLVPACVLDADVGIAVSLSLRGVASSSDVVLDEAWIHVADASLLPCDGAEASNRWALRPVARAYHGGADGRSLGTSRVVPLVADGAPLSEVAGTFQPPPGRYCRLRVLVMPATPASEGFLEHPGEWSLRAEGSRGGEPLALDGIGNRAIELPLIDTDGAPTELTVDAGARGADLEVEVDLARVVAALPDEGQSAEDLGLDVVVHLENALTARLLR
jgi:hypothetical protein